MTLPTFQPLMFWSKAVAPRNIWARVVTLLLAASNQSACENRVMFAALWKSRLRLFARHYGPAFNWTARRLVRMGLRKMRREALRTYRAGRIDYIAYEKHLSALREVEALSRLPAESFL